MGFKPATSWARAPASNLLNFLKKISSEMHKMNSFFITNFCEICSTSKQRPLGWSAFQYFRVAKWGVARRCGGAAWLREHDRQLVAESDLEGYKAQLAACPFSIYIPSPTHTT